ncbi:MAG: hypothetical protein WD042_01000 [Phycisphaeraceae bacterium]
MVATDYLVSVAREALVQEYGGLEGISDGDASQRRTDTCPALWVLHELIGLVEEFHQIPVVQIEPTIRKLIVEQSFVDENGDCVFDADSQVEVDRQVEMIVRVLERVRQQALAVGTWCEAPLTEQYVG